MLITDLRIVLGMSPKYPVGVVGNARGNEPPCIFTSAEANRHSSSHEIFECCLVAGMYPNIAMPVSDHSLGFMFVYN